MQDGSRISGAPLRAAPHPGHERSAPSIPWASELAVKAQAFGDLVCVSDGAGEITYRALADHAAGLAK